MNKIELLIAAGGNDYLKHEDVHICNNMTIISKSRLSEKKMMQIASNIYTGKIDTSTNFAKEHYKDIKTSMMHDYFSDFTVHADHIIFDFYVVDGNEDALIPIMVNNSYYKPKEILKPITLVYTYDKGVMSIKKSKKLIIKAAKKAYIQTLEGIANWVDDPKNLFNTFGISSFASDHFDTKKELRPQYLALAKKYHPDISNDDGLMFRAIKRTYEYLVMK